MYSAKYMSKYHLQLTLHNVLKVKGQLFKKFKVLTYSIFIFIHLIHYRDFHFLIPKTSSNFFTFFLFVAGIYRFQAFQYIMSK